MANAKKVVDVAVESALEAYDAIIESQADDIVKCVTLLVSVERLENDMNHTKTSIGTILKDVLVSQGTLTYGWCESVRMRFGDSYRGANVGASDVAVNKAWSRVFKIVTDDFGIQKPKSESAGAEAKMVQREKQAEKQAELLAAFSDISVNELQNEVKSLYNKAGEGNKPDNKLAKKEADKIVKVIDTRNKAENAERVAFLKSLKSELMAYVKECEDVEVLTRAIDIFYIKY